jgi:hypothetical protein
VVEPADAWLCAASSALIVAGDICEPPPETGAGGELGPAEVALEKSNGLVESLLPVDCDEDDFDEVSDLSASSADDAALRASSMARTPTMPHGAAFDFPRRWISKPRAIAKSQ